MWENGRCEKSSSTGIRFVDVFGNGSSICYMDVVLFFWRNEENIWQVLYKKGGKGIEIRNRHHFSKFVKVNEGRGGEGDNKTQLQERKPLGPRNLWRMAHSSWLQYRSVYTHQTRILQAFSPHTCHSSTHWSKVYGVLFIFDEWEKEPYPWSSRNGYVPTSFP